MYSCQVLRDSVSPLGIRLTTLLVRMPRFILAEFNTARMFTRSSASSRAIPVAKQLRAVMSEPFIPERFGVNQSGMQSSTYLEGDKHDQARAGWLRGRDRAVLTALELLYGERIVNEVLAYGLADLDGDRFAEELTVIQEEAKRNSHSVLNVHKQFANRVIEPYTWHTVVVTATEWSNFFALRDHENAQPEIRRVAQLMKQAMNESSPEQLQYDQWHMPFVREEEREAALADPDKWKMISAGRSARVSYETHLGVRDVDADVELANELLLNGHMSPFEHVATPIAWDEFMGNFRGFKQLRKTFVGESDYGQLLLAEA